MLYVIRHGQVDTNIKNQVNGWNEEKLNSVGIQQAINAGNQLKNIKIDSRATALRWNDEWQTVGLILKIKYGVYKKIA